MADEIRTTPEAIAAELLTYLQRYSLPRSALPERFVEGWTLHRIGAPLADAASPDARRGWRARDLIHQPGRCLVTGKMCTPDCCPEWQPCATKKQSTPPA